MLLYGQANIHQRINFKGNSQIKDICFGQYPEKRFGQITRYISPITEIAIYAERALMEYTRRRGDRPAKYSQAQFNKTV